MTIKAIKEQYKNTHKKWNGQKTLFTVYDWQDGNGKCVVVVVKDNVMGEYVVQVVRVKDGKELLQNKSCRPCDNLDDAIDVAGEMIMDGQ